MIKEAMKTFEFVSPGHPDKMCDQIADSILDAYLEQDPESRVAVEVMGGHGKIKITGEITSKGDVDMSSIARSVSGEDYDVEIFVSKQSPEIARGVDTGGAGDQGIMVGYACTETDSLMPKGYELARQLCKDIYNEYPHDGKVQVTLSKERITDVVVSFQNAKGSDLEELIREKIKADRYHINPAGDWTIGGFEADSGLSGRKIVIDNYGPYVGLGGGSFSGKDPTKVDRSGAYMARRIAVDRLRESGAKEVTVHLGYVIGEREPVMAVVTVDGVSSDITDYDLTPGGIIKSLNLKEPIYGDTATWGHFGRGFKWDK